MDFLDSQEEPMQRDSCGFPESSAPSTVGIGQCRFIMVQCVSERMCVSFDFVISFDLCRASVLFL